MSEPTIETLARRLDRVERENRWLKQAGVVALAVIAAVVLMGQATESKVAKVVEAEKFVVKDRDGEVRATLGIEKSPHKGVGLELLAPGAHNFGASLSTGVDGHSTLLFSDNGMNVRLSLQTNKDGTSSLYLNQRKGAGGIVLTSSPAILVSDRKDKTRLFIGLEKDESVFLSLSDREGISRAVLGSTTLKITRPGMAGGKVETEEKRPESSLVLFDKAGQLIWKAP